MPIIYDGEKQEQCMQINIDFKKASNKYDKSKKEFERAKEKMNNDEL